MSGVYGNEVVVGGYIKMIPTDFVCAYLWNMGTSLTKDPRDGAQLHPKAERHCTAWAVLSHQILHENQDTFLEDVLLYPIWGMGALKQNPWELLGAKISFSVKSGLQMKNTTGRQFLNSCIKPASISGLKWFPSASSPCSWSSFEIVGRQGGISARIRADQICVCPGLGRWGNKAK